jgi:hypothetical protein
MVIIIREISLLEGWIFSIRPVIQLCAKYPGGKCERWGFPRRNCHSCNFLFLFSESINIDIRKFKGFSCPELENRRNLLTH